MPKRGRSERTVKDRLAIALAGVLAHVVRLLPRRVGYWLADRCGDLVYLAFKTYRRNVAANLSRVLGPDASPDELRRITRKTCQTSARNFLDLLLVPHLPADRLLASVVVSEESWRHLDEVCRGGRGGVLVTAHYGAFDYVGQVLWEKGYDLTLLTTRTVPEFIHTAVTHLRASRGGRIEPVTPGGIRRVMMALRRGGLVGLVADRDFFQSGRPVVFFGEATSLPPGPARFARDTGAPIVAAFTRRLRSGYQLIVEPPFHVERTDDEEQDIRRALQRIVAIFERYIRQAPEQWVMFQQVWPDKPAPALQVFPVGSPLRGELLGRGAEERGPLTGPPVPGTARDETAEPDRQPRRPGAPRSS